MTTTDTVQAPDLPRTLRADAAALHKVAEAIEAGHLDDDTRTKLYLALVSVQRCYNELGGEVGAE